MKPKEKANELFDKFYELHKTSNQPKFRTIDSCLVLVNEIIANCPFKDVGVKYDSISSRLDAIEKYWLDVKNELENI